MLNKKKIIWTVTAIAWSGLAVYSIFFHQHEDSELRACFFCSVRDYSGLTGFTLAVCVAGAFYAYQKD